MMMMMMIKMITIIVTIMITGDEENESHEDTDIEETWSQGSNSRLPGV